MERVLMDRGFPEFHVKKELYWAKSPSRPEWMLRAQAKDMTGTR